MKQVATKRGQEAYRGPLLRVINQMDLTPCNGCDACGLRCAAGVPMTRAEYDVVEAHVAGFGVVEADELARVLAQDKEVDLGDGVSVRMCRYRDMERGRCTVYSARPLICRLFGHVAWLPCPIEKVPHPVSTDDAVVLMQAYSVEERHTFEEWAEQLPAVKQNDRYEKTK